MAHFRNNELGQAACCYWLYALKLNAERTLVEPRESRLVPGMRATPACADAGCADQATER